MQQPASAIVFTAPIRERRGWGAVRLRHRTSSPTAGDTTATL
ncbi:hypothetical protein [[Phormidium] sp. ETS-05]|nr:hypothetical protein [[Phormidium] sp. ETS-05]